MTGLTKIDYSQSAIYCHILQKCIHWCQIMWQINWGHSS